jgi:hypothetical protein
VVSSRKFGREGGTTPAIVPDHDGVAHPRSAGFWPGAPQVSGSSVRAGKPRTLRLVKREVVRRTRREIAAAAQQGLDWLSFAARVNDAVSRVVPFDRACWHSVDPGTFLFTGLLGHNMVCSGPWLAEHEYVLDDVNKWVDLARSGQRAAALSEATHGKVTASARVQSSIEFGMPVADELRASFVADGTYWAAAGLLRDEGPWFDEGEVRLLASLSGVIAEGFRRAVLVSDVEHSNGDDSAPGVVVLDGHGELESISPHAERWLAEIAEQPTPRLHHEARAVQAVAAPAPVTPTAIRPATRPGHGYRRAPASGCCCTGPRWPAGSTGESR